MDPNKTALERAFELAESRKYANVAEIRDRLKTEGYDLKQLEGFALRKQLAEIIRKARTTRDDN